VNCSTTSQWVVRIPSLCGSHQTCRRARPRSVWHRPPLPRCVTWSLVLPSRRSQRAETYADNAKFAAQPGSFVLALSLPLADGFPETQSRGELDGQQHLLDVVAEPYGRRVTSRMLTAVRQAQRLAAAVGDGTEHLSVFGRQEVANATELAALSTLGGLDHEIYQIRFAFSPRAGSAVPPENLKITPAQQRILGEAAEFLRTRQPRSGVTVTGHVVRATGDLDIRGTRRYLRNLTTFSVLESLDDE
jgi:hypothetical protein